MLVDQSTISQPVPITYDPLNMNAVSGMVNIPPINPMPLSSYDNPHLPAANVSMSIPVNNMSVNVNVNSLNLGAMAGMPVNTINGLPYPIQPMNIGMIDGQRNFTNMNSGIDIPITRTSTVLVDWYCNE